MGQMFALCQERQPTTKFSMWLIVHVGTCDCITLQTWSLSQKQHVADITDMVCIAVVSVFQLCLVIQAQTVFPCLSSTQKHVSSAVMADAEDLFI